jgi:hypothetical protein
VFALIGGSVFSLKNETPDCLTRYVYRGDPANLCRVIVFSPTAETYSLSICRYKLVLVHRAGERLHYVTLVAIFGAVGKEDYSLVVLDSNRVRYLAIAVSYEYACQTLGFALIGG